MRMRVRESQPGFIDRNWFIKQTSVCPSVCLVTIVTPSPPPLPTSLPVRKRRGAFNSKQLLYLEKYRPKMRLRFKDTNGHNCCVQ